MEATTFRILDSASIDSIGREALMAAREYVLLVKRTARKGGFGEVAGRIIRNTVGYKFDSAPVSEVLAYMQDEAFLSRFKTNLELWYAGLNKSASESTLKGNAHKYSAALALTNDAEAFKRLVKALQILCQRNQSWIESGNHLQIPYNGHKALLDLFCINVTNARRLALATAE